MFGFSFEKLIVIAVIAVVIVGPDRLPVYSGAFAKFVVRLRRMADSAKDRMRDELGPDFDDVDWKRLDPRQYDPRQIIRSALLDELPPTADSRGGSAANDGTSVGDPVSSRGDADGVK